MTNTRMSEGFVKAEATDWVSGFGMAQIKEEGAAMPFDPECHSTEPYVPTAWFERNFTAMEYAELAAILHASGSALARDVAQHMVECAKECL